MSKCRAERGQAVQGRGRLTVKGSGDEVWVVAVLAHLHEHVVEGGHRGAAAPLGHLVHLLLQVRRGGRQAGQPGGQAGRVGKNGGKEGRQR
jgi:hypothetical protein